MPQVPYDELPAYRLFSLELPQDSQRVVDAVGLPPYWQENTYHRSQHLLADWLAKPDVLALGVPSSVMPSGINYLLHPAHSSYGSIRIIDEKPLVIDPRLWSK
jgi:RES domain-containing protein